MMKFLLFALTFSFLQLVGSERQYFLTDKQLDSLSPNSLNRKAFIVNSQFGEDGIIEEIFNRLNIQKGFFVEFGAADGLWLCNTRYLWEKGWSGALIENSDTFYSLQKTYEGDDRVICIHETVVDGRKMKNGKTFDQIKSEFFPDQEIDFLVIDIDGLDYWIFKSLKCRPKVISIETNLFWHPLLTKEVPAAIAAGNLQQPLPVMIETARKMGYEPVCMTINLFLVRKDLMGAFPDTPSDSVTLWCDGLRSSLSRDFILDHRKTNPVIAEFEGPDLEAQFSTDLKD